MANKFSDLLLSIQNTQIRIALERMFAIIGVAKTDYAGSVTVEGDVTGDVTGALTGNVTGNVTGDVTGDVLAVDTATIVDSGADVANSVVTAGSLVGTLTGSASAIPSGTPVNAVASTGTITFGGDVIDGETVTIGTEIFEFDTDASVTGTNTLVDISGGGSAQQALDALLALSGSTDADVTLADETGGVMSVTSDVAGVLGDLIALEESSANITLSGVVLGAGAGTNGVDGTVGAAGDVFFDTGYIYLCTATNTIADANWERAAVAGGF